MAMFACMYFAALRPGEAVGLRKQDCHLPATGWGRLTLEGPGRRSTSGGPTRGRPTTSAVSSTGQRRRRPVPIPPELVTILRRAHRRVRRRRRMAGCSAASAGGVVASTAYAEVWQEARTAGPHSRSGRLSAGPAAVRPAARGRLALAERRRTGPEVAERAGHGVDVLLRVYAKCIDGQEEIVNRRIEDALAA